MSMGASEAISHRGLVEVRPMRFEEWVEQTGPRMKRLAYLLTGDPHQAEDLLQEAYAKAMPKWKKISEHQSPEGFMYRVMVNQRTSWWRKLKNREVLTAESPEPGRLGLISSDAAVDRHDLRLALAKLPDKQRAAVVLRHWCDLSEAQAADVMGCSIGAIKSNTSRGLATLRAALANDLSIEDEN